MDDLDRRISGMIAASTGIVAMAIFTVVAVRWLGGGDLVASGAALIVVATLFGMAAVDTEESG